MNADGEQVYSGRVSSVVYQSDDFRIAKVILDGNMTPVTVKGHFPAQNVAPGSWVSFAGKWVNHAQYGRQLMVTRSPVSIDRWTPERIESALASEGIGPQLRFKLKVYAEDAGMDLQQFLDAGDLSGVPDLDDTTRLFIVTRWRSLRAHLDAAQFLSEAGVPAKAIGKVWSSLGDELEDKVTEDPWILVRVAGISFKEADEVALRLGVPLDNTGRLNGAVLTAVQDVSSEGHVYALTGQVVARVNKLIPGPETPASKIAASIKDLVIDKQLVVRRRSSDNAVCIYEPWMEHMEQECARMLAERAQNATAGVPKDKAQDELSKWAQAHNVSLTDAQLGAAFHVLTEPVSVITGLPGSGKTTTMRAAVSVLKDLSVPFLLAAPTGIAAKRLSSVTGSDAATIHRAFSAKGWQTDSEREATYVGVVGDSDGASGKASTETAQEDWGYGPKNPHPAQVVIVDESSMLDLHMLYRLLQGTLPTCRMVFVGDPFQLPSVGAGDVLRDLVNSKQFAHTHLSDIFRQQGTSSIVVAAHAIHAGQIPQMDDPDFMLLPASDEATAAGIVRKVAKRLYDQRANFQVLSPKHRGDAGVTALNDILRMAINPPNPGLKERNLAGSVVREGDRIMVIKNDYQNGVFNGDVGKVARIDHRAKTLAIHVLPEPGKPTQEVSYDVGKGAPPIRLAYAQTVHKCVHPDTLVETSGDGITPISEIPPTGMIRTPDGFKPYTNKVIREPGPSVTITTGDGYTVTVTPDHGMDTWDGDAYARIEAEHLAEGSWLRLPIGGGEDRPLVPLPPLPPGPPQARTWDTPPVLDETVAEFLGLMVADGTVYQKGFRLAKRHADVVARFTDLCERIFKVTPTQTRVGNTPAAEVNSTLLATWLGDLGGINPKDKYVPPAALRSGASVHKAFLRGLFEDGTVNVREGRLDHVAWSSSSVRCVQQVRLMLLRLGIVAATCQTKSGYTLSIRAPYLDAFRDIGFVSAWKNSRLDSPPVPSKCGMVPMSKAEASALRKHYKDALGVSLCQNAMNRGMISRNTAARVVALGGPLEDLLRDRLRWHHTRVSTIELGTSPSMCVEVPEGHRFLQDGFSGWNSQGQEYDVIVVPMLTSFGLQLQRNLLYTAITRAKKRVFIVGEVEAVRRAVGNDRADRRNTLLAERLTEGASPTVPVG